MSNIIATGSECMIAGVNIAQHQLALVWKATAQEHKQQHQVGNWSRSETEAGLVLSHRGLVRRHDLCAARVLG